jgi:hypothetical protein
MIVNERLARESKKIRQCNGCPDQVMPGQRYYSWSFRYGGRYFRHVKCGFPPRSMLTQSKIGDVYLAIENAEEELKAIREGGVGIDAEDDVRSILESVAEEAERVAGEYRDAAENFGGGGENAERADELESYANECQGFAPAIDEIEEGETDQEVVDQYLTDLCQEAQDILDSFSL